MFAFIKIFWLLAFIVFLVFEIITLGLTSIWFAGGALVAFIASLIGLNIWVQVILFFIVSFALLFFTRPFAEKYLNRSREKTNVDALAGKIGYVTIEIDNLKGRGEVSLSGHMWSARSADDTVIAEQTQIEVIAVEGVKVIVKRHEA